MADLGGESLDAGARQRDRLQQLGVAVARDDLGRDGLALESQPRQHPLLELRRGRRIGADRARQRADRGLRERPLEPLRVAVGLEREPGELDPESGRLGVDPVGAPDAQRVDVLARLGGERLHQPP